jgi:hypothetical protein
MAKQVLIRGQEFLIAGEIFKILKLKDEWDVDIKDPHAVIEDVKNDRATRADVFYFRQRLPHTKPIYEFHKVIDNAAAIPITTYEDWWKEVNRRVRLKVNKAQRLGVTVRVSAFSDDLVQHMKEIFDDDPLRQGVPFRLYKKSHSYIKDKMGTFADRADFLCAFYDQEPIGILKLVYSGQIARMMTIIGKISSRDKAPVNAMLSKAVELCVQKSIRFLMYGRFYYGKKGFDSVVQFKLHNGFKKYDVPRYYVPLTNRGRLYIALRLYRKPIDVIPESFAGPIRMVRERINTFRHRKMDS